MPFSTGRSAILAVLAIAASSCAFHMGKKASEGAMESLKNATPDEQPSRVAAGRAISGAFETLEEPEQQQRMRANINRAVDAAVASTLDALNDPRQQQRVRELVTSVVEETTASAFQSVLGPEGGAPGPAAVLAAQIAQAATREAMREVGAGVGTGLEQMFPGCAGADAEACRRQRLRALTREAGAGLATGVLEAVRWPLLFATGLLGLIIGLVAHWLWTLRPRPSPGGRAPTDAGGARGGLRPIAESRVP